MWFEFICVLSLASGSVPSVTALAPPPLMCDAVRSVPKDAVSSVPKLESARAQLDFADDLRRGLRSAEEPARKDARVRAADAYGAVREHFGGDAAACAEAAFRRADLLRQSGDIESARAEYGVARERGANTPWRPARSTTSPTSRAGRVFITRSTPCSTIRSWRRWSIAPTWSSTSPPRWA